MNEIKEGLPVLWQTSQLRMESTLEKVGLDLDFEDGGGEGVERVERCAWGVAWIKGAEVRMIQVTCPRYIFDPL